MCDLVEQARDGCMANGVDGVALAADQMMMRGLGGNFVVHLTADLSGYDQTQFAQKLDRPIDGGSTHDCIPGMDAGVNLFRRRMTATGTDCIEDHLPLRCKAIALLSYERDVVAILV